MSTPIAEMDGDDHRRVPTVPDPVVRWTPSARSAAARKSSAGKSRPSQSNRETPSIVTFPSSSWSVPRSSASAIIASGAGPPNSPEWSGCSSVRIVTTHATSPRSVVVSVGSPTRRLPMSQTMKTSAANSSGCSSTKASRLLFVSSMPSTISFTVHGRLAVEDLERPDMDREAPLVVGSTPAEDAAVLARRRPGVRGPPLLRRRGLDVVVAVEHHDGRAVRPGDLPVDRGIAARHLLEGRVREPDALEHLEGLGGHLVDGLRRVIRGTRLRGSPRGVRGRPGSRASSR